jgi:hypothetical protein
MARHIPFRWPRQGTSTRRGAARLIIGSGQYGTVALSDEAAAYFERNSCQVELLPMPEVIQAWNEAEGAVIGLLHVTC